MSKTQKTRRALVSSMPRITMNDRIMQLSDRDARDVLRAVVTAVEHADALVEANRGTGGMSFAQAEGFIDVRLALVEALREAVR